MLQFCFLIILTALFIFPCDSICHFSLMVSMMLFSVFSFFTFNDSVLDFCLVIILYKKVSKINYNKSPTYQ